MSTGSSDGHKPLSLAYSSELYSLNDATFLLLRDLIADRTGVFFDDAKRGLLADKVSELVASNGLTSFLDYYYLLRYDDPQEAHVAALMNRLSVPETFFWRQVDQIEALANVIAPEHFARNPHRPLKIWSAACCTGEEPISIAMALAEAGILGRRPVEIMATDGSAAMIDRARRNAYTERSFRQLSPSLRDRYFARDGDHWRAIDEVRRNIRWGVANLVRPGDVEVHAAVDAIYCRNVFIYFNEQAIKQVVTAMSSRLLPDGHLFLGASESIARLGTDLELVEIGNAFAYEKTITARSAGPAARASAGALGARGIAP